MTLFDKRMRQPRAILILSLTGRAQYPGLHQPIRDVADGVDAMIADVSSI